MGSASHEKHIHPHYCNNLPATHQCGISLPLSPSLTDWQRHTQTHCRYISNSRSNRRRENKSCIPASYTGSYGISETTGLKKITFRCGQERFHTNAPVGICINVFLFLQKCKLITNSCSGQRPCEKLGKVQTGLKNWNNIPRIQFFTPTGVRKQLRGKSKSKNRTLLPKTVEHISASEGSETLFKYSCPFQIGNPNVAINHRFPIQVLQTLPYLKHKKTKNRKGPGAQTSKNKNIGKSCQNLFTGRVSAPAGTPNVSINYSCPIHVLEKLPNFTSQKHIRGDLVVQRPNTPK